MYHGKIFYLYYINIYIHVGFKHFDKEKKERDLLWEENFFYLKGNKIKKILMKILKLYLIFIFEKHFGKNNIWSIYTFFPNIVLL